MPIQRPEKVIYGVEDMAAGIRYFEDWGLELLDSGDAGAEFKTGENQHILLRLKSDPELPDAPGEGSTAHEVIWGAGTKAVSPSALWFPTGHRWRSRRRN